MSRSIFTIVLILLMLGGVTAGTIKVPTDYATIQAGIDAAVNGDTVLVAAGTYYENINFKGKAIVVASYFYVDADTNFINNTIIDGSRPSDPNKGSVVSFTSAEDTTSVICGFTITGGTGTMYDATIRIGGGVYCANSGARISHNKIVFNIINHAAECEGGGIGFWPRTIADARYLIIEDNVVESNSINSSNGQSYIQGGGIHITKGRVTGNIIRFNSVGGQPRFSGGGGIAVGCKDEPNRTLVVISGNTITHNRVYAPSYGGGWGGGVDVVHANVQIINNTISHNEAEGGFRCVGAGIRLWKSEEISLIKNNTVSFNSITKPGWTGGIELFQTNGVQVIGNRIEGNNGPATGGGGIDETYSSGNLIKENFIKNNTGGWGGGIFATNSTIINNIIVENKACRGGGIFCFYHPDFTSNLTQIINNTVTKNVADTAGSVAIYKANTVVMNTICWDNTAPHGPEIEMWGGTLNAAYSDIRFGANSIAIDSAATVNWLAGNIDANPFFDFSSYQLSNSSPCIGTGIEMIQIEGNDYECPNSDIEGNLRPNPLGSMPDIGAYENPLDAFIGPILVPEQYATIQEGINAASDGNMVLVADGTYYENINYEGKAITVASHYLMDGDTTHINNTIIDGSQPSHADSGSVVFFVSGEDTSSVICGFTITGGTGTITEDDIRGGGGIFCFYSGARITNNKIINNTLTSPDKWVLGGGLAALPFGSTAYLILQDNQIMNNTITANANHIYGGGVYIRCDGTLINNTISFNSVIQNASVSQAGGGGVYCFSLNVIMEQNKITHNSITSYAVRGFVTALGGGCRISGYDDIQRCQGRFSYNEISHNEIWVNTNEPAVGAGIQIGEVSDSFVIEGNIIRENATTHGNGWGGGAGFGNCNPLMINNIISGNKARRGGGLFITLNCKLQLVNNTIVNNHASETGGGLYVRNFAAPILMNNIIWNNQAPADAAIYVNYSESATVQATYCDIQGGWSGTENIDADPLFADTLFHLSENSPCIGTGVHSYDFGGSMMCYCPGTDMAGSPRPDPSGSYPDMGAYESTLDKPTKVSDLPLTEIPQSYFLAQNYPNPFNPSTTIEFALPNSAFVTLKVYNLLGEEVATLIAEQRSAGIHKFNWDARGLASGVYLYRLEAGISSGQGFVQVKKLILMR